MQSVNAIIILIAGLLFALGTAHSNNDKSDCSTVYMNGFKYESAQTGYYRRIDEPVCANMSVFRKIQGNDIHYIYFWPGNATVTGSAGWVIGHDVCENTYITFGRVRRSLHTEATSPAIYQHQKWMEDTGNGYWEVNKKITIQCTDFVLWPVVLTSAAAVVLCLIFLVVVCGVRRYLWIKYKEWKKKKQVGSVEPQPSDRKFSLWSQTLEKPLLEILHMAESESSIHHHHSRMHTLQESTTQMYMRKQDPSYEHMPSHVNGTLQDSTTRMFIRSQMVQAGGREVKE